MPQPEALRRMAERIASVHHDGLEEHSPSRVFAGLGPSIPDGVAKRDDDG